MERSLSWRLPGGASREVIGSLGELRDSLHGSCIERPTLHLYADGSGMGRAGGWAWVLVREDAVVLSGTGGARCASNNLMELQAVAEGLGALLQRGWHRAERVELVSDSKVALDCAAGLNLPGKYWALAHTVRARCLEVGAKTRWVRGHSGEFWNDYVDGLAREACLQMLPAKVRRRRQALASARSVGANGSRLRSTLRQAQDRNPAFAPGGLAQTRPFSPRGLPFSPSGVEGPLDRG